MADFFIRNPLVPTQLFTVSVTMRQYAVPSNNPSIGGDPQWVIEAASLARDCNGDIIEPERIVTRSFETIDEEINELVNKIASKICWESATDTIPPYIDTYYPQNEETNIPLEATIELKLLDGLERENIASGINKNTIKMFVKGFEVTDKLVIEGNPWEYNISCFIGSKEI